MSGAALEEALRAAGARITAALAVRFRDLDLAEEALAEACARAAAAWPTSGAPADGAAWLYRAAERCALDALRRQGARSRLAARLGPPDIQPPPEIADDPIPDERLRLIFICCHPAMAPEARAALTLRLVCGLTTREIASAFLVSEATLAQRLVRAKHKIARAGAPFETPSPEAWPERMEAVLSTLEVAYAKSHEDAAGAGAHAGYAQEMLRLSALLVRLAPDHGGAHALAALIHYAEARRPARLDATGAMIPLSEQDPALWRGDLMTPADRYLARAKALDPDGARTWQAALHGLWRRRASLETPPPWGAILAHYDALLARRDDPVVRLNRAVALAEVAGPAAALAAVECLDRRRLEDYAPWHAVRAEIFRRLGRRAQAREAYDRVLALGPGPAERLWLERRRAALGTP